MASQKGDEQAYSYAYTYRPLRHTTGGFLRLLRNEGRVTPDEPAAGHGASQMQPAGVETVRSDESRPSGW
jgi:hypothetical protein